MTEAGTKDERMWGMLCHLTALSGFVGVPFGQILGPLVIWLLKKEEFPFVDDQGKESLNFQISMTIYSIVAGILIFVMVGILLLPVIIIANIILTIMGTVKANNGEAYRYPFTMRLIT